MTPAAGPDILIEIEKAALGYGPGAAVLRDVDLSVERGDFLGIVGPNGSGKSTLLKSILGLIPPLGGHLHTRAGLKFGYVPQRQALDPIYPFRTLDVVVMGLYGEIGWIRRPGAEAWRRAAAALEATGIGGLAERLYRDLSGGQQQRTLVARALVSEPDLLVLDEPTNDLDLAGERGIMDLVTRLHDEGRTVLLVSHMLNVVAAYVRRIALIDRSRLAVGSVDEMLTAERLGALYEMKVEVVDLGGRKVVVPEGFRRA